MAGALSIFSGLTRRFAKRASSLPLKFAVAMLRRTSGFSSEAGSRAKRSTTSSPASLLICRHSQAMKSAGSSSSLWLSMNKAPNPSIEATSQSSLRALWAAPHVER